MGYHSLSALWKWRWMSFFDKSWWPRLGLVTSFVPYPVAHIQLVLSPHFSLLPYPTPRLTAFVTHTVVILHPLKRPALQKKNSPTSAPGHQPVECSDLRVLSPKLASESALIHSTSCLTAIFPIGTISSSILPFLVR